MSKELIVSTGKHETRVAILEDDQLVEVFHEREKEYSLAGSIHKGRVTRVLPGMQSAFVDIGLERDAFLYVSDFFEDSEEFDAVVSTVEDKVFKQMEKRPEQEARIQSEPRILSDAPTESGEIAVAGVAAPPVITERRDRPQENRPPSDRNTSDRNNNDRNNNDRNGRGRRGRRRRGGGRDGGLPDSKFASATEASRADEAEEEEAVTPELQQPVVAAAPQQRPQQTYSQAYAPSSSPVMILPGESLAKYSAPEEPQQSEVVDVDEHAHAHAEAAMPVDHPFAGFGGAQAWSTPEPAAEEVVEAAAEPVVAEQTPVVEEAAVEVAAVEEEPIKEPLPEIPVGDPLPDLGIPDHGIDDPPVHEDEPTGEEEPQSEDADAEVEASAEDEVAPIDHEGPEPARIPTSLTATLREQGNRYPHRASRRMRRKMRGGPGDERGDRNNNNRQQQEPGAVAPVEEGEQPIAEDSAPKIVEARDDNPPQQQREPREQNRGGRDRGGNREPREARGERQDRGEARPERSDRERTDRERNDRPDRERPVLPSIADLLKEGQEIIVQIAKEPLGQKGARITSHIALPGRFVVYMPTVDHAGVSRKIPSDEERHRLKKIVQTHRQGIPGGFICRTAADGKTEEELKSDMHFLYNLWLDMRAKAEKRPAPVLLHHDLDLVQRILRDQLTTSFKNIWVDGEELYESVLRFAHRFQPALVSRVKLYTRKNPIFDEFGITAELEKALRPKVWLKSGGYIVINQTEALVAIDINTGKYVGKSNRLEDTIVKINTDAIKEIVRQIRLRDLGGIIVVDFIDMDERKNRQKVMLALEESMRSDRAPYKILQFNDFGLVAITRKRVKQSLERTLCSPCPYCEGAGYVKSVNTVVSEILQEAQRMQKSLQDEHNIVLRVNPEVAKVLKSNQNQFLQEIEEILGKSVLVKGDPLLHQTKFDLA